jgi:hypothetical protein
MYAPFVFAAAYRSIVHVSLLVSSCAFFPDTISQQPLFCVAVRVRKFVTCVILGNAMYCKFFRAFLKMFLQL